MISIDEKLHNSIEMVQIWGEMKIEAVTSEMSTADIKDCPLISMQAREDPNFHPGSDSQ